MDLPNETPRFDCSNSPKRRRTTPNNAHIDRLIPRCAHSPTAAASSPQSSSEEEEEEWESQPPLLTQPPPSPPLPPPPSPPPQPTPAPSITPFEEISPRRKSIINRACSDVLSIDHTRDFQVTAAHYLSFNNHAYLSMIRRTADGKSLVPLCTAVLRRKVTLIMVPLHGLGSDQVDKSTLREKGVNAYYIDQHKRANEAALRRRLEQLSIDEAKASCTILFVSPQVLAPDSAWFALFESMAKRDLFSLFCIDEAHSVHQDGRAFRVQFNDAVKGIQTLHSLQSQSAPRLIMSATLRPEDQNYVTNLLGQTKPVEMMGDLSRRETRFSVFITGRASSSLYRSAAKDMEQFTEAQQIWYSNSAMSAEEVMVPKADELLQKYVHPTGKESVAMSFTGSDGLILKTALMSAFTNFLSLTAGPVVHDDGTVSLPCIQILVGTQSINAGVSSNFVKFVKQKDLPRNIYDLVQELGRANRLLVDDNCSFEVHLDFKSSTRLFLSCMSNADPSERNITWEMALEVLSFLVTPSAVRKLDPTFSTAESTKVRA
jgi:hypothetical protein